MRFAFGVATAALLVAAAPAVAAQVTVLRGPAPARVGSVSVLRGTPSPERPAARREAPQTAFAAVAGGSFLWLIDASGQVTACGVRGAIEVGAPDTVHCSQGPSMR